MSACSVIPHAWPVPIEGLPRTAKQSAQPIGRQARQGMAAVQNAYRRLVQTAQATLKQAQRILDVLPADLSASGERVRASLSRFIPCVQ